MEGCWITSLLRRSLCDILHGKNLLKYIESGRKADEKRLL